MFVRRATPSGSETLNRETQQRDSTETLNRRPSTETLNSEGSEMKLGDKQEILVLAENRRTWNFLFKIILYCIVNN
ncbi:hypothetical protein BsWGS_24557 [Bradybaena similaris]